MSNPLAQSIDRLSRHRAVRASGRFLTWWRDELVGGLPARWREKLKTERERLIVRVDDERAVVTDGAGRERASFERAAEPAVAAQSVQTVLAASDESRPEIVAVLPAGQVLERTVTLPAATADSLRQVLTFEMDRHTPFRADEVYFDHRIEATVGGGAKIRVALWLARREDGEALAAFCRERGLALHGIDAEDEAGRLRGINLLPPAARARRDRRQLRLNLALAVAFVLLLELVLWQSVASREAALDAYRDRLAAVRAEAAEVLALRDELEEAAKAARFLAEKKAATPPVLDLVGELTARLPDDTWLNRLQVNGDVLQVSGQAPVAAPLVALLQGSPCLDEPNLRGAVTPDPETGNERFTIQATIRFGGRCFDGPASS